MNFAISNNDFVIFDLDDTLFKEVDFLKSAYREISKQLQPEIGKLVYDEMLSCYESGQNAFDHIKEKYSFSASIEELVFTYRFHTPEISLERGAIELLTQLRKSEVPLGLITDGRSKTQRNKLTALGIGDLFAEIIISEEFGSAKPSEANYRFFEEKYPGCGFTYIADNFQKDFVVPNALDWNSIGIRDDGRNIHTQAIQVDQSYLPKLMVESLEDIKIVFK